MQNLPEHIAREAEEVTELLRKSFANKICSVVVFGSAVRGWKENPEDLDILIVVDVPREEALEAKRMFVEDGVDLRLGEKYGLHPQIIILSKEDVGGGSASFYYSIVHDGVAIYGEKAYLLKR